MTEQIYKNFKLILSNQSMPLATQWLLLESEDVKEVWLLNQSRQRKSTVLRHTENIHLRCITTGYDTRKANDILEMFDDKHLLGKYKALNAIYNTIQGISTYLGCTDVGRIFISKLLAGCEVGRHTDEGNYFNKYKRYHLVLYTNPDAACEADKEECFMPEGTVWFIRNGFPHSFWNKGKTDRIHVIWDAS